MRNPSLDILRAVAVLLVFCYHCAGVPLVTRFGWTGVDLFFVLSGFLVSGLLFREYRETGYLRPGRFLLRRGLKIYPQFYFFVAFTFALACWRGQAPRIGQVLAELGFVQNYAPGIWAHTWSLAIEEHFYLLLTFGFLMLSRRGGANPFRALPVWIAGACGLVLGLRLLTWVLHPEITDYRQVFPSHLRMDSLLTGVGIAYYQAFHGAELARSMKRLGPWIPPASILLLAPVSFLTREDPFMVTAGFSMVSWGFGLLLLSVLYPAKPAVARPSRGARAMAVLGQNSYAFYLWQGPVLMGGDRLQAFAQAHGRPLPLLAIFAITFFGTLLTAFATTRLLEIPVLRLRDRYFPAPPRRAPSEERVLALSGTS